jgi:hypothetical protein
MRHKTKLIFPTLIAIRSCLPNVSTARSPAPPPLQERVSELYNLDMSVTYDVVVDKAARRPNHARPSGFSMRTDAQTRPTVYVSMVKQGDRWVAEQVSFQPIARPTPQHEVLRFWRNGLVYVSPAFEMDAPLTTLETPSLESAVFSCGNAFQGELMREREGQYTICSTQFTRPAGLAAADMYLLAGPLGAGRYRMYSQGPLAQAVLETGIAPMVKDLLSHRQALDTSIANEEINTADILKQIMDERVAAAMGRHVTSFYSRKISRGIQFDVKSTLDAISAKAALEFAPQKPSYVGTYPVEAGGASPQAIAALANITAAPRSIATSTQVYHRLSALLDETELNLPCVAAVDSILSGAINAPNWVLYHTPHCEPFALWPKPGQPPIAGRAPAVWTVQTGGSFSPIKVMAGFALTDPSFTASVSDAGALTFENKTDTFLTIKSVSFYVNDKIITQPFDEFTGRMPPQSTGGLDAMTRRMGDPSIVQALASQSLVGPSAPVPNYRVTGLQPISQNMGFAILYEVNGQQNTLLRRQSFAVVRLEEANR